MTRTAVTMKPLQSVPLTVLRAFLPGPLVPMSALASTIASTIAKTIIIVTFAGRAVGAKNGMWLAAPMKNSIGIESRVFVRDAKPARCPLAAASGIAWPPFATWVAEAMTIFWAGQMMNQTLNHMSVPVMP